MSQHAIIHLKEHDWSTYFGGEREGKWVGRADARNRNVLMRRYLRWMHAVPILKRVPIRVAAHELDHLRLADFTSNADHHDDSRWVDAAPPGEKRRLHECGRSYSIKADDASKSTSWLKRQWMKRRWFSLKHISPESIQHAKILLRQGWASVDYEEGSLLWQAVNSGDIR